MQRFYLLVLSGFMISLTVGCKKVSSRAEIDKIAALEQRIDESRHSGTQSEIKDLRKNLTELGGAYEAFAKDYPEAPETPEYLFRAGELYSNDLQDYPKAIEVFLQNYQKYPNHETAGNALFFVAHHYNNSLHDLIQAERYYKEFLDKYPQHKMAPSAQFELSVLGVPVDSLIERIVLTDTAKGPFKETEN